MSNTNEIRNRPDRLGQKLLDATSESKTYSLSINNFKQSSMIIFTQIIIISDPNIINKRVLFLFYGILRYHGKNHMNIKGNDEMLLLLSLNVSVSVLPSYFQGIFQNYVNCFSIDSISK